MSPAIPGRARSLAAWRLNRPAAPTGARSNGVLVDDEFAHHGIGETPPGKFEAQATIQTQRSARTIGVDPKTHKLYLPAAQFGPPEESKDGKQGRPSIIPGSFEVLVLAR